MSNPKKLTAAERLTLALDEMRLALAICDRVEALDECNARLLERALRAEKGEADAVELASLNSVHHRDIANLRAENERLRADVCSVVHNHNVNLKAKLAKAGTPLDALWPRPEPAEPYGTTDESPGFNAAWQLGSPKPAAPYVQPKGKAGQVIHMSESFEYVGSASSPLPPAFEAATECRDPAEIDRASEWDMPAAPARTEAEAGDGCECPGAHECGVTTSTATNERKARTEAEQAVLDAMATAPRETLMSWAINRSLVASWLGALASAELALRGLKR